MPFVEVTVAVKVTFAPGSAGDPEVTIPVVVALPTAVNGRSTVGAAL